MFTIFFRTIYLGLQSLLLHKMRAALAGLGIFIGTTTVIWLVAVGEGVSQRSQDVIKELGAKNVIVRTKKQGIKSQHDFTFFDVSTAEYSEVRIITSRL